MVECALPNNIENKKNKRIGIVAIILIIILGFSIYGNCLNNKFIWDDRILVKENRYIKSWSNTTKFLSGNISPDPTSADFKFYRPFQMMTYALDYSLWKLNVRGYHLTNIILHIFVALAVYWLINLLYVDRLLSFLASIFFVVHPIHIEAVTYISGRSDSLAGLFMLLAFIFYIKALRTEKMMFYILMVSGYICSLLSREASFILPVLLLVYHYSFKEKVKARYFSPLLAITLIYILLRPIILKDFLAHPVFSGIFLERLPGFFVAVTNYVRLLALPLNLHMAYGTRLFSLSDPRAIIGILIVVFLLIYAFKKKKRNQLIFFSISWFFVALLPVSNLYPLNAYMAEHWLYVPSIGAFLILAKSLTYLYRRKETKIVMIIASIGLLVFYSFLTIKQNRYWGDPIAFYKMTLRYAPDNSTLHANLGFAYDKIGKKEEAILFLKKSLEIDPTHVMAYYNLAFVYNDIGEKEKAMTLLKKALEIDSSHARAYYNLAFMYNDIGEKEKAISLFKKAIKIDSDYIEAYNNLGALYANLGEREKAMALFKKSIEIDSNSSEAYYNIGQAYSTIGNSEKEILSYKKAIEINPVYAKAYDNLAIVYNEIGKNEEAIASLKKAIEVDPDYAKAYFDLSAIYFQEKQHDLAIKYCDRAVELGFKPFPEFIEKLKPYRR